MENKNLEKSTLVLVTCGFIGVGFTLPFSFYISADAYWKHKWRIIEDSTQSFNLDKFWGSNMVLVSMGANFLTHLVNIVFGPGFQTRPRIISALILNTIIFSVSIIFTQVETDSWQLGFYFLSLGFCILLNMNDSIFAGAFQAIMARFPPSFMGVVSIGRSAAGIISTSLSIILMAAGGGDLVGVAFWYFLCAPIYLVGTLGAFLYINRHPFYKHHLNIDNELQMIKQRKGSTKSIKDHFGHLVAAKKAWKLCLSVFLVYTILYSMYPAVLRLVEPVHDSEAWRKYLIPVGVLLGFAISDFSGSILATYFKWPGPTERGCNIILLCTVLRIGLLPLLLLCNLSPDDRKVTSVLFKSDAVFLILHMLMSFSSGYLATIALINAPQTAERKEERSVVGVTTIWCLVSGLLAGSALSYLWVLLL